MSDDWHETSKNLVQDFSAWCRVEADLVGCKSDVRVVDADTIQVWASKEWPTCLTQDGFVFSLEQMRHAKFPLMLLTMRFSATLANVKAAEGLWPPAGAEGVTHLYRGLVALLCLLLVVLLAYRLTRPDHPPLQIEHGDWPAASQSTESPPV